MAARAPDCRLDSSPARQACGLTLRSGADRFGGTAPADIFLGEHMFSHITVGSNDLAASKTFYDAVFGVLGAAPIMADPAAGRLAYAHGGANYMICTPLDGQAATHANGGTIGFGCTDPAQVDAWHAAGCAAGGKSCEDAPGVREFPFGKLYLAYLRDPDGNKLCALHAIPA
jgi:catechol 2,3-dioxygenase-like lactoylglutathione lyase family enzyme